ncbi:MAG TPA: fibronectin type III domain-containing protein [Cyclobacteriaceae bacterium]|nr:fibronectin type III domain-containing protein [Cyclobacteriaceae bacterium]
MSKRWLFSGLLVCLCSFGAFSQVTHTEFNLNSSHRELANGTVDPTICPNPPDDCHCKPNSGQSWDVGSTGPFKEGAYVGRNGAEWPEEFMNWRMIYPTGYDENRALPYPMIVMLHGAGEGGRKSSCCGFDYAPSNVFYDNNGRNISIGGQVHLAAAIRNPSLSNSFPGIVIWPQSSYNGAWDSGWQNGDISSNNRMVSEIIQFMIRDRNVDPDRIAMHGLSNGAQGVWDLAAKRSDLFASILPMSGVGSNQSEMVSALVTTPIWIFQGSTDTNPAPSASLDWQNAFIAAGGSMTRTVYQGVGHGTWNNAYAETNFFPFIKSKTKRDIYVFGGIASVCSGGGGLKLGFSAGFAEYTWTKDGIDIDGSNDRTFFATTPGTYTVKYRRQPNAWNPNRSDQWGEIGESSPLVVSDAGAATYVPLLTNTGSVNLTIDLAGIDNRINFIAPPGNLQYTWFKNGVQIAQSAVSNTYEISSNTGTSGDAGSYTVTVLQPSGCGSLPSNPIVVTWNASQPNSPRPAAPSTTLVNEKEANITWTDYGAETGYEVWRIRFGLGPAGYSGTICSTPPGKYSLQSYQLVKVLPANTTSYRDTGLRLGNAWYRYLVRAILPSGQAIFYNDPNLQVVTALDTAPPTVPGNLGAASVTATGAVLSWTASTDNDYVYAYEIYNGSTLVAAINGVNTVCSFVGTIPPDPIIAYRSREATVPPPTTYTITGLEGNASYNFSVRALDWMGNYSPFSQSIEVNTQLFAGTTNGTGVDFRQYTYAGSVPSLSSFDFTQPPSTIATSTNFTVTSADRYVSQWEGYIDVRSNEGTGAFIFSTQSSTAGSVLNQEPSQIYIDNDGTGYKLVVNNPGTSTAEITGTITFSAIGKYPIKVLYAEGTGSQTLTVRWTTPLIGRTAIPNRSLYRLDRTFYYLKTAAADPTVVSAWATSSTGSGGTTLTNWTTANRYYVLTNQTSINVNNPWTISGAGSRIVVGNGSSTAVTVNVNNTITGRLESNRNGVVALNTAATPTFGTLHETSTVNFNVAAPTTIPVGIYGNVNLTQAQAYTLPMNIVEVQGSLDIVDGATTAGQSNNFSTLKVGGNLTFHNTAGNPVPATASTAYALTFTGGKNHTIEFASSVDPIFFSIQTDVDDVVTFNNPGGIHTYTIGTTQGGGLSNRGTINVGANDLIVTGRATINTNGETGDIAINGGNFTLSSTASTSSTLYFNNANHTVNNLSVAIPTTYSASIQSQVDVTNLVSLAGGNIISGGDGYLKLLSSLAGTARIGPLAGTSRISGPITAQRFMEGEGTIYRYMSMPVKGVKVSDLQNYFPVTGNFTGASTGPLLSANASLFDYNESIGYVQFPPVGGTNQDTLRYGRGYSGYIREGLNPTTWQVKGVANQGTIPFVLTGGTGPTNGWNLVGNPFPAPIKWRGNSTSGWTMSGVGSNIAIRENTSATTFAYRYWNGSAGDPAFAGVIATGQAFWVQTNTASPTLSVGEAAKQITDGAFYKDGSPENVIAIKMKSGSLEDNTYIQFDRNATPAYEKAVDAFKLSNSFFNLSTLTSDGISVAINLTTSGQCDQTISFRTSNAANGNYQLILSGATSLVAGEQVIFTDAFTNTTVTLGAVDYTHNFSITAAAATKADGRFKLKFVKPGVTYANTLAADAACNNNDPVVLIHNSQPGVDYKAFVNGTAVSNVGVGNGGNLELPVNHTMLPYGKTSIQLTAGFLGCQQYDLTNTVNVTRDTVNIPQITMNQGVLSAANVQGAEYQWLFEGEIIDDAVAGEFMPLDSGAYKVQVTKASCVLTSQAFVKYPLYLNLHLSSESVCNTDAVVVVQNSQPGAKYKAFFGSIDASSFVVGTGGPISIPLDASVINSGQKDIQVQVGFENDLPKFLANNILVQRDVLGTPIVVVDGTKLKTNVTGDEFKWYLNGSLIPNATGSEIDFTAEGVYSVQVASGLCSATSATVPLSFTIRTDLTMNSQAQCDSNSIISIQASQPGVTYAAYDNGVLVSDEVVGTGETITLTVNTSIGFGQKQLTVKAGYLNSVKHDLQSAITVNRLFLATPNVSATGQKLTVDVQDAQYKWFLNGEELANDNTSSIEPAESGSYYVVVSNGVCTRESAPVNYAVTGIGDELPAKLALSPNPAKNRIVVVAPRAIDWSTVRLSTATGQGFKVPMSSLSDRSLEMDISDLTPGFYLVHVNGEAIRLVKE